MKALRFLSLCLLLLLVAACSGREAALPTRAVISELATSLPTNTPVSPTATATTLPATNTPLPPTLPPTLTSTPEPAPTATALPSATPSVPFTQGTLYFVWRPDPKPAPEDMGPEEVPAKKLYRAIPGTTPNQWTLEPVLTDIRCFCQPKLSPDKTQLAFIQTEAANQDGSVYDGDRPTIYTYNFAENRLTRLDHFDFSQNYSWLSDSETLLFSYGANLGLVPTDGSPSKALTDKPQNILEGTLYEPIDEIVNSFNGQLQAITIQPGIGNALGGLQPLGNVKLFLFDVIQNIEMPILDTNGYILVTWDPNNRWLAAIVSSEIRELFVIDTATLAATQIVTSVSLGKPTYPPAWSTQGEWLAFLQDKATLWSWHQPTALVEQLASKNFVGSPVWSPHEDVVAVSFTTDEGGGILLANPAEKSLAELTLDSVPIGSPIWTPDGQWLLFPTKQNETTGYYLIHRQGGDIYPVFDTTGLYEPSDFFWLSD